MTELIKQFNWFYYQTGNAELVEEQLKSLLSRKDLWLNKAGSTGEKILFYVECLVNMSASAKETGETYKYFLFKNIDVEVLKYFVEHPDDKENRDLLSKELIMVYAAVGGVLPVETYGLAELQDIFSGDYLFYDDNTFVCSLVEIFNNNFQEYSGLLEQFLLREKIEDFREPMDWETALLYSLFIGLFWGKLIELGPELQKIMLKNYFYMGVVAGFPVRKIINDFLTTGEPEELNAHRKLFFEALQNNQEEIPLNNNFTEWRKLVDFIRAYSVKIKGSASGFEQEEFLKEYYQNQNGRDVYRGWLREVLNIIFNLEK